MSNCQFKAILSYKKELDQMYHVNTHLLKKQLPPHCTFLVILYQDCIFIFQDPVISKTFIFSIKSSSETLNAYICS